MLFRKKENRLERYGWVPTENSQERTRALVLIESALFYLANRRVALIMEQNGKKSEPTILRRYNEEQLLIGLPPDGQPRKTSVRFHYRDHSFINCYFDTTIDTVREGMIHARIPDYLVRLQRRAHYRVEAPGGSEAVFFNRGAGKARLTLKNVSAGGMLGCGGIDRIRVGSILREIELLLASPVAGPRTWFADLVNIPRGRVVRAFPDGDSGLFYYGIAFECGRQEEANLLNYVRQREIEIVRVAGAE
jgi:c-di-GMP-binding flagellar brake protein YcgR